jgi:putative hemin transport protein
MEGLFALTPAHPLTGRWRLLRDADPFLTLEGAAARLDVVEAELVASLCGEGVLRLDGPLADLIAMLPELGRVRAVTRNSHAAIETRGVYPPAEIGCAGVAGEIGARFLPEHWRYGYALDEASGLDGAPGLFFYDARGDAVHELHAELETDRRMLGRLVDLFASFDQSAGAEIALASPRLVRPRADLSAWLRHAEDTRPVPVGGVADVLESARREAIPVSITVSSPGVAQRFSGLLHDVTTTATGLELQAPWVTVCIATSRIAEAWLVRTPSLDGPMSSIELLDSKARVIASVSGARWPGKPESDLWRALAEDLAGTSRSG